MRQCPLCRWKDRKTFTKDLHIIKLVAGKKGGTGEPKSLKSCSSQLGAIYPPSDTWQCVEIFWVVKLGGGSY